MRRLLSLCTLALMAACSAAPPPPAHDVHPGVQPPERPDPSPPNPVVPMDPEERFDLLAPEQPETGTNLETSAPDSFPAFSKVSDETRAKLVASQNRSATDFYTRLATGDGNLIFSPASISFAFGMVYAGARGETADQMARVFRYDLPQDEIHAAYGTVLRQLDQGKGAKVELTVANRLFGERTKAFKAGFVDVTADHYRAEMKLMDFRRAPEDARVEINDWIADRTKKRIKNLIPERTLSPATALVLVNAIYFKGDWKVAFDAAKTKKDDFTTPSGVVVTEMMHGKSRHRFAEHDGVKMLEMAYAGDKLTMQLVLSSSSDGLPALEQKLGKGLLGGLSGRLAAHDVVVTMPRFTIKGQTVSLTKTLKAMGLIDAFHPEKADLRAMARLKPNENLFVQGAFHKAFIEVKEEGTEAAAATAIVVDASTTSVQPPPPPPMVFDADHPFLFVIRDRASDTILFMGRVNDPTR